MKTTVIEAKSCPNCGSPLPAGALAGFCPKCLLAQGADTDAGAPAGSGRFAPPPVAEVAALFPQLEILGLLGAGGMGAVYKARQPALDRIVALKILPAEGVAGVNFEERFNREARALARLSHPNIVTVHEFGRAGALHFFIMEFVDGANLRQLEQAGRLAPREALQIVPQICDALQYAHDEGIVHRDIKPENVLVDRRGRVKIADFGLAKILGHDPGAARLTAEGQVMGTPHYMAPEQVERPLTVDHRADIYSLGVVLYEMLTGDLPLGKFSPPSRKVQVDVRFDEVVLRALENDPARRYQKASEVKSRVETIAATPAPAPPDAPAPAQNFVRWARFPLVVERDGKRQVNQKEALKAFAILFGVLTIAFGMVSLITGRSLFGWIGIAGSLSLQMRLLIAAVLTTFGIWRAMRSKPAAAVLPRAPQGTVILPAEKFPSNVRVDGDVPLDPWWTSKPGAVVIIAACWLMMFAVSQRREQPGIFKDPPNQVAKRDATTGALVAKLPGGGRMELLALADAGAAPNEWWRPDGTPLAPATFEIKTPGGMSVPNTVAKDLIFRFVNLPNLSEGGVFPSIECNPGSGNSSGNGVRRDGQPLEDTWPIRMAWPERVSSVAIRLGVSLVSWRTVATSDPIHRSTSVTRRPGDPRWQVYFHQAGEIGDRTQLTIVRGRDDGKWQTRVVAVDFNDVEHPELSGAGTPSDNNETWTYTFKLPLKQVKEFQVQARPVHWVEFRDIPLNPRDRSALGRSARAFVPTAWSASKEIHVTEFFDFDKGLGGVFPTAPDGTRKYRGIERNPSWTLNEGRFRVEVRNPKPEGWCIRAVFSPGFVVFVGA